MTRQHVMTSIGLILVLGALIGQAYHPLWRPHLQVDVVTFQHRAASFLSNDSWHALGANEYQPGALWFFVLLGTLTPNPAAFDAFLTATVLVNSLLIVAHVFLLISFQAPGAVPLFLVFTLATGPILLYRFELLTSLLVLGAWYALQRGWLVWASTVLGLAIATKVYPLVLVPLFVAAAVQRGGWRRASLALLVGLAATLAPVLAMLSCDGTITGLIRSLEVHQLKPVGLEGVWGSVVAVTQTVAGMPVRITPGYGVQGLTSDLPVLTNRVLNNIWVLPYVLAFWLIWRGRHQHLFRDALLPFTVLMAFVVFAKVLNPQYLWWFASLAPLIGRNGDGKWPRWIVSALLTVTLVLTQLVYPVHYTEFLHWFNTGAGSSSWFVIIVLRNGVLLVILAIAIMALFGRRQARLLAGAGHAGP